MNRYMPGTLPPDPAPLAAAAGDARRIASRYQGSRRVEHGFLSSFYLLQREVLRANCEVIVAAVVGIWSLCHLSLLQKSKRSWIGSDSP